MTRRSALRRAGHLGPSRPWWTLALVAALSCRGAEPTPRARVELVPDVPSPDAVVANVDGRPILASDVVAQARAAGTGAREALEALVRAETLVSEAARRGLDTLPEAFEAGRTTMVYRYLDLEYAPRVRAEDIPQRDVERAYERNRVVLDHDEYVDVWHILVPVRRDAAAEVRAEARALADEISRRARGAQDVDEFRAIANLVTVPPSLGRLVVEEIVTARKGWTVREFSEAAFDQLQRPGDVTAVVPTEYGLHVLYLVKRIPAQHLSLAEAAPRLREGLWPEFQRRSFAPFVDERMRRHSIAVWPERLGALGAKNGGASAP